jgi:hypothetical protein
LRFKSDIGCTDRIIQGVIMAQDTSPHLAKFISSQQRENSQTQKQAISLGKALVQELGLEPGVDTLSRWMAHYIAEQITTVENESGEGKSKAEIKCFNTILKLWQHRSAIPNGKDPFKRFGPIFHALEKLDPENKHPYFFNDPPSKSSDLNKTSKSRTQITQKWIKTALGIDRTARLLIGYSLKQAAKNAIDGKTISWINKSIDLGDDEEKRIIVHLIGAEEKNNNDNKIDNQRIKQRQEKSLKYRIEILDVFLNFIDSLRKELKNELDNISKEKINKDRKKISHQGIKHQKRQK